MRHKLSPLRGGGGGREGGREGMEPEWSGSGRVGEWESGRVGERERGRVGEREKESGSGRGYLYPVQGQKSFEQIMNALFACGNLKMAVVGIFYCASLH